TLCKRALGNPGRVLEERPADADKRLAIGLVKIVERTAHLRLAPAPTRGDLRTRMSPAWARGLHGSHNIGNDLCGKRDVLDTTERRGIVTAPVLACDEYHRRWNMRGNDCRIVQCPADDHRCSVSKSRRGGASECRTQSFVHRHRGLILSLY